MAERGWRYEVWSGADATRLNNVRRAWTVCEVLTGSARRLGKPDAEPLAARLD